MDTVPLIFVIAISVVISIAFGKSGPLLTTPSTLMVSLVCNELLHQSMFKKSQKVHMKIDELENVHLLKYLLEWISSDLGFATLRS